MALHIAKEVLRQLLEQKLRAHPMVAARLSHKAYKWVAEAAVKHYVWSEPFPVNTWPGTSTAQLVKNAFDQLSKNKQ